MTRSLFLAMAVCGLAVLATNLRAQPVPPSSGPPNALQGFSKNKDQPIEINSATLEVRDKENLAIFKGDVHVKQGDTTMVCKSLFVFYEREAAAPASAAKTLPAKTDNPSAVLLTGKSAPAGQRKIKRFEAHGSVVVTQEDQVATGDFGVFEMAINTVTLTGNPVVMTQGKNVMRGEKVIVNLTTGVSRVEPGKGNRVQGLFVPHNNPKTPDVKPGGPTPLAPVH